MINFKSFLTEKKKKMKTLYVKRKLLNASELIEWAKKVGFETTLEPDDMHITCAFSKEEVDWNDIHLDSAPHQVDLNSPDEYEIKPLGDKGAVVLKFSDEYLESRWKYFRKHGASWDYEGYQPHVSITYDGADMDVENIHKFSDMRLLFGPEIRAEVDLDWDKKLKEE